MGTGQDFLDTVFAGNLFQNKGPVRPYTAWPVFLFTALKAHRMNLWVTDDSRINVVLNDSDIASSRADAMGKAPVFQAHEIDYTGLGAGQKDRDRRLVIQLDTSTSKIGRASCRERV